MRSIHLSQLITRGQLSSIISEFIFLAVFLVLWLILHCHVWWEQYAKISARTSLAVTCFNFISFITFSKFWLSKEFILTNFLDPARNRAITRFGPWNSVARGLVVQNLRWTEANYFRAAMKSSRSVGQMTTELFRGGDWKRCREAWDWSGDRVRMVLCRWVDYQRGTTAWVAAIGARWISPVT